MKSQGRGLERPYQIPVDAIIELWREQSSHGRYSKQFFSSLESLLEASGDSCERPLAIKPYVLASRYVTSTCIEYPFHQCKSLYWDNPVRVGYNPPMSSFGMLLSDLLGVLFGAEPGET